MSVFDGLAEIFAETFGEPVIYTPHGGAAQTISAIWIDTSLTAEMGDVDVDVTRSELSVRASDIASPREGDTVVRGIDGRVMKIVTPIQPDGKGMIVCNLEKP